MKTTNQENVTRNLLQFCYTCDDAHKCTTEEMCKACWTENGLYEEQANTINETQQMLQLYYA